MTKSGCAAKARSRKEDGSTSGGSGPPYPVTTMPSMASAGYVKGTVTNADRMPAAPRARQKGAPPRVAALSILCVPRFGFLEKLKMPCPAGLSPVRNDDQAVGVTAGTVERSGL